MALCETCSAVFQHHTFELDHSFNGADVPHHDTPQGLMAAVENNCWICWRFFNRLPPQAQQWVRRLAQTTLSPKVAYLKTKLALSDIGFTTARAAYRKETAVQPRICLELDFHEYSCFFDDYSSSYKPLGGEKDRDHRVLRLCLVPTDSHHPLVSRRRALTHISTDSNETWATIRSWINNCSSSHSACEARRAERNWFPTRLLEISAAAKNKSNAEKVSVDSIRLVSREQVPAGSDYVSLSHRWGTAMSPAVLTTSNLEAFTTTGVPLSCLSRTFLECFHVALMLGVRYVWIDSLCIIQDGDGGADWLRESATMDRVYTNGLFNISADWGAHEKDGLFFARDHRWRETLRVQMKTSTGSIPESQLVGVIDSHQLYDVIDADIWYDQVSQSPLNRRGWVFQERLLSPRVLHFCPREVLWECCETTLTESNPDVSIEKGWDRDSISRAIKKLKHRKFGSHAYAVMIWGSRFSSRDQLYLAWQDIVAFYTSCQLTRESDKLPAIAGVARYLQTRLGDIYILGIWGEYLAGELLWACHRDAHNHIPNRRSYRDWSEQTSGGPGYIAPSFTWASVDCQVKAGNPLLCGILVKVVPVLYRANRHVPCVPLRQSVYGPVSYPSPVEIQVTGILKRMRLSWDREFTEAADWRVYADGTRVPVIARGKGIFYKRLDEPANLALGYESSSCESVPEDEEAHSDKGDDHEAGAKKRVKRILGAEALLDFAIAESEKADVESSTFYYMQLAQETNEFTPNKKGLFLLLQLVDSSMGRFRRIGIFKSNSRYYTGRTDGLGTMRLAWYLRDQPGQEDNPCWSYDPHRKEHTIFLV
ncbi:hypothetical protein QBC47DRAFT_53080 [Echria macrotheca]|uniref:Heterokaryon incompatibility domain-containing protein n=1 Tax=Echria macrotheca TaxID=438768 RepID=A0AAJ0F367_9PEZI|nr:hypothetical protein QBC47DRAFT_53080 [Echria macrotheca]